MTFKASPFRSFFKTSLFMFLSTAAPFALLTACSNAPEQSREVLVETESARLNDWFEQRFKEELARSPISQTALGQKSNYDKLDDMSQLALDEEAALKQSWLEEMHREFDIDRLDAQTQLSYKLFEYAINDELQSHNFGQNDYVFQHMSGPHSELPSFMINLHKIDTADDARAYIARLNAFTPFFEQARTRAQVQFDSGVILPAFVYDKVAQTAQNIITGAPFAQGDANEDEAISDSPLWADFKAKLAALKLPQDEHDALMQEAEAAMTGAVGPAYTALLTMFSDHREAANDDDGAWKLPDGQNYYQARLRHYTTTDLTADEIHEIGLKEVARIQDEMRVIMAKLEFEGDLQDFFNFLRSDPQFTYSNDDAGRDAYIKDATKIIDDMRLQLDSLFITKPKADMVVKRVEEFREDSAFGAFYEQPSLDRTRPGTYYINLKDVTQQPKFLQQALAYHEGLPGHHMQIAIAMELEGLPKFRTLGGHTAYIEGWALYSESVPAELGLYKDLYSDFGRLSMEIFRAARLVVDTGIHAKQWTREQAVQYYLENIPNPEGDVRAEIDRYIVWPGQATAYKIGMLKIQELRDKAKAQLGDTFSLAEYHDLILANGSVPLTVLEDNVNNWITEKEAN